jgi:hypothetical protein
MESHKVRVGLQDYVFGKRERLGSIAIRSPSPTSGDDYNIPMTRQKSPFGAGSVALPRLQKGSVQHQMIVAYIYQQQCSRLWISDMQSLEEGAFMRETWNDFITCPPLLSLSPLAKALADLNAEVSFM